MALTRVRSGNIQENEVKNVNIDDGAVDLRTLDVSIAPIPGEVLSVDSLGNLIFIPSVGNSLSGLADVDVSGIQPGDYLQFNGTQWVPISSIALPTLNQITDVNVTGVTVGEYLQFDGTNWINATAPGGETNTGDNLGGGAEVFANKLASVLRFRTIVGGPKISTSQTGTEITINTSAIENIVEDTNPQLGGDLNVDGFNIVGGTLTSYISTANIRTEDCTVCPIFAQGRINIRNTDGTAYAPIRASSVLAIPDASDPSPIGGLYTNGVLKFVDFPIDPITFPSQPALRRLSSTVGGQPGDVIAAQNDFGQLLPVAGADPEEANHFATRNYVDVAVSNIPLTLNDLTDVNVSAASVNEVLAFDGVGWVPVPPGTGPQGPIGLTGSQGDVGFTGSAGADGATGFTGSAGADGAQGADGAVGFTGSQGDTGFTGSEGAQGPAGTSVTISGQVADVGTDPQATLNAAFPGATAGDGVIDEATGDLWVYDGTTWNNVGQIRGFTGSQGDQGTTGFTGSEGAQGATGFTGSEGPTGFTGSEGAQGPIGLTGSQGDIGPQGLDGGTGFTGSQGDTGIQGPIGLTGSQGDIGFTGSEGAQGVTGFTGSEGAQGPAGADGTSVTIIGQVADVQPDPQDTLNTTFPGATAGDGVIDGTTGDLWVYDGAVWQNVGQIRGFTGSQGPQGDIGFTGSEGAQGPIGLTGSQGNQGFTGSEGAQGPIGLTGSQGDTGIQGPIGLTGSQGDQGFTGSQGPQGPSGADGLQGPQGLTGSQGTTGFTGSEGAQGPAGTSVAIVGSVADVGTDPQATLNAAFPAAVAGDGVIDEATGDLWVYDGSAWDNVGQIRGFTGSQGPTGAQGAPGFTGSQGAAGFTGSQGDTGLQGPQGPIGLTGSQGVDGFTGSQGDIGFTGSEGAGFTGSQGVDGFTGSEGAQGLIGLTGSQGDQGVPGFTGSEGATGFTGSEGVGFTGSQGDEGPQGPIGLTGSQGAVGFTGSEGAAGATELGALTDVSLPTTIGDGDALIYDDASGLWIPGTVAGGNIALNDLTDVDAPAPTDNSILVYDGDEEEWVPRTQNIGTLRVEEVVFRWTTAGDLNGGDVIVSSTPGITANIVNGPNNLVEYEFTGYSFAPVMVMAWGQRATDLQWAVRYPELGQSPPPRIIDGGTLTNPDLLNPNVTTGSYRMDSSPGTFGADPGFGDRVYGIIRFLMVG